MRAIVGGTTEFGEFVCPDTGRDLGPGDLIVSTDWCNDGTRDMVTKNWVLFRISDTYGDPFCVVPPGTRVNGLSSPRITWRIVWPYEPRTREASVLHDALCVYGCNWAIGARLFWLAMRANGVGPIKAFDRWLAVRYFGGWNHKEFSDD